MGLSEKKNLGDRRQTHKLAASFNRHTCPTSSRKPNLNTGLKIIGEAPTRSDGEDLDPISRAHQTSRMKRLGSIKVRSMNGKADTHLRNKVHSSPAIWTCKQDETTGRSSKTRASEESLHARENNFSAVQAANLVCTIVKSSDRNSPFKASSLC